MLYCTYDMLNMFRALLCPSSGARDLLCVITAYGVQCLVAGCRSQIQGSSRAARRQSCSIPLPGRIACCLHLTPTTSNQALHTIGGNNTQ